MNHDNRSKAARVTKTAESVLEALKQQGIVVSSEIATAAIASAVANSDTKPKLAKKATFRLFFAGETGRILNGIQESVTLEVKNQTLRGRYRCDDKDAALLVFSWVDGGNNFGKREFMFLGWNRESFFEQLSLIVSENKLDFDDVTAVFQRLDSIVAPDSQESDWAWEDFRSAVASVVDLYAPTT